MEGREGVLIQGGSTCFKFQLIGGHLLEGDAYLIGGRVLIQGFVVLGTSEFNAAVTLL